MYTNFIEQPIKVLHVVDTLKAGGAERVLVELVNHLDKRVISPTVCVTRGNMALAGLIDKDIPVYDLGRQSTWDRAGLQKFGAIVRHNKIAVIHAHGYSSSHFVGAAKLYNRLATPTIMHAHSSGRPGLFTRLFASFIAQYFIGVSPQVVEWAQTSLRFPAKRAINLSNAIDMAKYTQAAPIRLDGFFRARPAIVGMVVANPNPVKDFDTLLHALALSRFKQSLGVLIAGSLENGPYVEHCKTLAAELGLAQNVAFMGSRSDIPQALAAVDFGLLSSERETGPVALLEYMAAGLPFVVTRAGQVAETVERAAIPDVVPTKDPVRFAEALDELLALPQDERRARGLAGRALAQQQFNLQDRINELQTIYQTLVKRPVLAGGSQLWGGAR